MSDGDRIVRHKLADRIFHWVTAGCMLVLLVTGFLPVLDVKFDWVPIHWITGLVLTAALVFHIVRTLFWQRLADMWVGPREIRDAVRSTVGTAAGRGSGGYRPGKYSVAQVLFHFAVAVVVLAATVTGLVMLKGVESPFWERDPYFVSEATRGLLFAVHGFAALVLVTMIMMHVYFAFRPEKLYFTRSMILGWMTRREYTDHHDPRKWQEAGD